MYGYGVKSLTIRSDMPLDEILIKQMIIQVWNHYSLIKAGVTTLTELGYRTHHNEIPAFWVDVFNEVHRLVVEADKNARK